MHKEDCPPISRSQLQNIQSQCRPVGPLPRSIDRSDFQNLTEDLFFTQSQNQLKDDLTCLKSKMDDVQKNPNLFLADLKLKLPQIKLLRQEAKMRIMKAKFPTNPTVKKDPRYRELQGDPDKLSAEAKQLLEQSDAIAGSLPFGDYPEIQDLIEALDEEDLKSDKMLLVKTKKHLQSAKNSLIKDIWRLNSSVSKSGELSRSLKERVMQDETFYSRMRSKLNLTEKSYDGFFCKLDAKYGKGTQIAETALTIGSSFVGLGVFGFLGRTLKVGSTAKRSQSAMIARGGLALAGGATSADVLYQIKRECLPVSRNRVDEKKAGASCASTELQRTLSEGNCALSVVLPALGFGSAALVGAQAKFSSGFLAKLKNKNSETSTSATKKATDKSAEEPTLVFEWKKDGFVKKRGDTTSTTIEEADGDFDDLIAIMESTTPKPRKVPTLVKVPDNMVTQQHFKKYAELVRSGNSSAAKAYEKKVLDILNRQKMTDLGPTSASDGGARFVRFEDGTMGVWKPQFFPKTVVNGMVHPMSGVDVAKAETLVYKLDRFLGLNRVPPTVRRSIDGKEGSVQLMVGDLNQNFHITNPDETRLFDHLINHNDRHLNNYLVTKDGQIVAIDNGSAFNGDKIVGRPSNSFLNQFDENLKFYDDFVAQAKKQGNAEDLPVIKSYITQEISALVGERKVYNKIRNTSEKQWRETLKNDLDQDQIATFLKRRKEIIGVVEKARKKFGENIFREGPASPIGPMFEKPITQ